jgi:mannose-6-phosphate isomerase-like protein (cupin superfamily)
MLIKKLNDCPRFIAGDDTILREMLHPDKEALKLRYSLAHAVLKPRKKSYPHSLKTSEVYFILEGRGLMHIGSESKKVSPGDTVYIPPRKRQFIENTGLKDLKFICIVDPAWRKRDETVFRE